jgi:hypothetical protein
MPTPPPDRSRRSLDHWQRAFLIYGPDRRWADAFADEQEVCEAWNYHRARILTSYRHGGHGHGGRSNPEISDIRDTIASGRFCLRPGSSARRSESNSLPTGERISSRRSSLGSCSASGMRSRVTLLQPGLRARPPGRRTIGGAESRVRS